MGPLLVWKTSGCTSTPSVATYFFSNSPVRWRFTKVVLPVPPSPTRTSLKVGISCSAAMVLWGAEGLSALIRLAKHRFSYPSGVQGMDFRMWSGRRHCPSQDSDRRQQLMAVSLSAQRPPPYPSRRTKWWGYCAHYALTLGTCASFPWPSSPAGLRHCSSLATWQAAGLLAPSVP
ncbi:hypothetical protein E2C01_048594 [Portunus trituberculatus]|uniref:Uncharacterized protein n=1 Tax=Portunus trituberculatus TaxID=210409 RepID=A0A5B7G3I3_PORTR|nr:hypothetical protein [Portunus trituberculatus]